MSAGWQFNQTNVPDIRVTPSIDVWSLRFMPQLNTSMTVHPQINISELYNIELTLIFNPSIFNLFGELLLWKDGLFCLGAGWNTLPVLFQINMKMAFRNCYKNVFNKFCNLDNWFSPDAKYIDDCTYSNSIVVTIYKYNPYTVYTE
jgi:hypothetical protein